MRRKGSRYDSLTFILVLVDTTFPTGGGGGVGVLLTGSQDGYIFVRPSFGFDGSKGKC